MSDELKQIYGEARKSDRFFDKVTPCELWRAQSGQDYKKAVFIMEPHPGYEKKNHQGEVIFTRLPDVDIVERDSNKFVKGCRCISGDYRGISTFDIRVTWLNGGWKNYRIPKETALPANLAITKDHFIPRHSATHYTIAPKDDMTLELFIQSLKAIADKAEEVKS